MLITFTLQFSLNKTSLEMQKKRINNMVMVINKKLPWSLSYFKARIQLSTLKSDKICFYQFKATRCHLKKANINNTIHPIAPICCMSALYAELESILELSSNQGTCHALLAATAGGHETLKGFSKLTEP